MIAALKGSPAEPRTRLHAALASLVAAAVSSAPDIRGAAGRLDQAARRWSREIATPAEVVTLVAQVRSSGRSSRRREEILDRVALVAVSAVAERQVREALTDPLTGLATRARLQEEAQHLLAVSTRDGSPLTAVVLDIDGLKRINDEQGHAAGDAAIAEVGRAIREHVRGTDRAFRWGGDEFVLLMPSTTEHGARLVVDRIQQSCSTATSAGIATHEGGTTVTDLVAWLSDADADLYRTRGASRGPRAAVVPLRHASRAALIGVAVSAAALGGLGATTVASTFGVGGSAKQPAVVAAPAGGNGAGSVELREHRRLSRPAVVTVPPTRVTPVSAPAVHRPVVTVRKPVPQDLLPETPVVVPAVPSTPTTPVVPLVPEPSATRSLVQQLVHAVNATLSAVQL